MIAYAIFMITIVVVMFTIAILAINVEIEHNYEHDNKTDDIISWSEYIEGLEDETH